MSRWTVRSETSSRSARARAGIRPCAWSSRRIDSRRSARMRPSVAQNHDIGWHGFAGTVDRTRRIHDDRTDEPIARTSPGTASRRSMKGTLPWSWARERLERAMVYWLATAGTDGAPHLIPIWGAWVRRPLVRRGWPDPLAAQPPRRTPAGDPRRVRRRGRRSSKDRARELVAPPDAAGRHDPGGLREVQGDRLRGRARRTGRPAASGSCSRSRPSPGRPSRRT